MPRLSAILCLLAGLCLASARPEPVAAPDDGGRRTLLGATAFTLPPVRANCTALCAPGYEPGGSPLAVGGGKQVCSVFVTVYTVFYGTWEQGLCRYLNGTDGKTYTRADGYFCLCKKAGADVEWKASLACAAAPGAADTAPPLCRVKKPGSLSIFRVGWLDGANACRFPTVLWGFNGQPISKAKVVGGILDMRVLCAKPAAARRRALSEAGSDGTEMAADAGGQRRAGSRMPQPGGRRRLHGSQTLSSSLFEVWGNPNCAYTCAVHGRAAIGSGTPGQPVCGKTLLDGTEAYGSMLNSECHFINPATNKTNYLLGLFNCACRSKAAPLPWKPSAPCIDGAPAAATAPAVCRVKRPQSNPPEFLTGWVAAGTATCNFAQVPWGKNNALKRKVTGLGAATPYDMQVLCRE